MPMPNTSLAIVALGCFLGAPMLPGQCTPSWVPGAAVAGVDGVVNASTWWDPDGAGPTPTRLVIGGSFTMVGSMPVHNLAMWEPVSGAWSPVGGGLVGSVSALAVSSGGALVVGGYFGWAGSLYVGNLASWNGTTWSSLGSNGFGSVTALVVMPNGDIMAAVRLQAESAVFRHAGNGWNEIGRMWASGWVPTVTSLVAMPNGDLVAAGWFTSIGWASIRTVARWDGSGWTALGSGVDGSWFGPNPQVNALLVEPGGDLVVGGNFTSAGGVPAPGIARWNGSAWSAVGTGFSLSVGAFHRMANGDLVAGGFTSTGSYNVARWDGVAWTPLGIGVGQAPVVSVLNAGAPIVRTFATLPTGDLFAGGLFRTAGSHAANSIARWDGSDWSGMLAGTNGPMRSVLMLAADDYVVGGDFTAVAGVPARSIARCRNGVWSPLGVGFGSSVPTRAASVRALARLPNGDYVAAGDFDSAGGAPVGRIACWNGTAWTPLGAGVDGRVNALVVMPNGDLVTGGAFTHAGNGVANGIARWDGAAWSPLGSGVGNSPNLYDPLAVHSLLVRANGSLVVGGLFSTAGGSPAWYIARWDGAAWSSIGAGMYGSVYFNSSPGVFALAETASGDLIAGGRFTTAGTVAADLIARWDGTNWSAMGQGLWGSDPYTRGVHAILPLPNGDLLVGGSFGYSSGPYNVARWNGVAWSPVGTGLHRAVAGLAWNDTEALVVGEFVQPDPYSLLGPVMAGLARLAATCPANAVAGSSCVVGEVLAIEQAAWAGSTYRARATGMPGLGVAIDAIGWSGASVPLASILPEGVPGCDLSVVPVSFGMWLPVAGVVTAPAIAGQTFLHQVLGVELDVAAAIVAVSSTNTVAVTIGTF